MTARRVYFFSGPLYSRFDHPLDAVPGRYPLPILVAWPGMFLTVDAAVNWGNGKVYFFKDSEYVRYDVLLDAVDPGYPKGIAGVWTDAASATFDTGIDAAVNWGNGKVYLFKGGEYIRHDIASDTLDPGYPKPIKGNWPGVSGTAFERDIDAVVNWGNGKVYWFKGDVYARFDQATKTLEPGYPKAIAGNWPGVFTSGISAAVEWPMADALPGGYRVPDHRGGCVTTPFAGGSRFTERFEMNIDFEGSPYPTTCAVGEYRQYVRGEFRRNGVVLTHLLADPGGGPPPAMLPIPPAGSASDNFLQDGAMLAPPTGPIFYGHRKDVLGNTFTNNQFLPDRDTGCSYRGIDNPGAGGATGVTVSVRLDFRGEAVDAANGDLVLHSSSWSVTCGGTA